MNHEYRIGCNYWASHAGTNMWEQWNEQIVDDDLRRLSESGVDTLRVFPLWPVFQPIKSLRGYIGGLREVRMEGEKLPEDDISRAGVSVEALEKFEKFTEIACKYDLKLIVSLITGWMSGRFYAPQALESLNAITDAVSIMWQVRFVKTFVKYFKEHENIIAWELGNECNCLAAAKKSEEAWLWTSVIVDSIRAVDHQREIWSGMHSLPIEGLWSIQDQGELTDMMTTHPYPIFTPYCDIDPINTMRNSLHATAESCLLSDISRKPCLVEEMGTLSNMLASEETAANYLWVNLFSTWAHQQKGLLWWCAYEQTHLEHAPYDWSGIERELGLFRQDNSEKPVMKKISDFKTFLKSVPYKLPENIKDAVCILTQEQDFWGVAYSSFILAKQAGFNVEFQYAKQPIKESKFYMMPCITGGTIISRTRWMELLAEIKNGATLYISYDGGMLSSFEEAAGIKVVTRQKRIENNSFQFAEENYRIQSTFEVICENVRAEILATDEKENPVFTCANYGKGKVYFLGFALETSLVKTPRGFDTNHCGNYYKIYKKMIKDIVLEKHAVEKDNPEIGITEHILEENKRLIIGINYSPTEQFSTIKINEVWKLSRVLYGESLEKIPRNDALVFEIIKG